MADDPATEPMTTEPVVEPVKKPDTMHELLIEWLLFVDTKLHRERLMQPGDAAYLSSLVARMRALA